MSNYTISSDPEWLDIDAIHAYLSRSYWSPGIPRAVVEKALANSICVGAYRGVSQVGFARAITDTATFAYIADVYVLEAHRGFGLASAMIRALHEHPQLQGLRRKMLITRDAHALYRRHGYQVAGAPENIMEIRLANPYPAPDQAAT